MPIPHPLSLLLTLGLQLGEKGLGLADGCCCDGHHAFVSHVTEKLHVGVMLHSRDVGGRHRVKGRADEGQAGHTAPHVVAGDTTAGSIWVKLEPFCSSAMLPVLYSFDSWCLQCRGANLDTGPTTMEIHLCWGGASWVNIRLPFSMDIQHTNWWDAWPDFSSSYYTKRQN